MALFSSTQPSLRARILPRFPAQVLAGNGISITKSGGTYVFAVAPGGVPLTSLVPIAANRILGRDAAPGSPMELTVGGGLQFTAADGIQMSLNQRTRSLVVQMTATTSSSAMDLFVPASGVITRVTLLLGSSGSVAVDILKDTYANFPPTASIVGAGGTKPSTTNAIKYQDSTLTAWNTALNAGDVLRFTLIATAGTIRTAIILDALLS